MSAEQVDGTGRKVTPPNNRQSPLPCPHPPARLYHGTAHPFEPGDVIVPGRDSGHSRGQWVWMLEHPATSWAQIRSGGGVGYVCEVEPIGEVQTCRGAYRARRARVLAVTRVEGSEPAGR